MNDLNAFITEILTVDYSYFRNYMEVLLSVDETTTPTSAKSWRVETNWETAKFGPFINTEIGIEYAKEFATPGYPISFPVNLLQYAITDLLNLPKEQLQSQINRLFKLDVFWSAGGEVLAEYTPLRQASENIEGIRLSTLNPWFIENGIITKNIPIPGLNHYIFLREDFYKNFFWLVGDKLKTLGYLFNEVGISPVWRSRQILPHSNLSTGSGLTVVFIKNDYRTTLVVELKPYIDEWYYDNLINLINGETTVPPIIVNCKQNTLGKIFYEGYKNDCTQASKKAFAKWICEHFQRQTDGEIHMLTDSTMESHLKGRGFNDES